MRPSKHLRRLHSATKKRLNKLYDMAIVCSSGTTSADTDKYISYITIETQSTWSNFVRSFYLSCTTKPRTIGGNKISSNAINFNDALGIAITRSKPRAVPRSDGSWNRRDEPSWHIPKILIDACNDINCSHANDVVNAFSSTTRVYIDLPVFRNFYAHRNRSTELAAMNLAPLYGISATIRPSKILTSYPLGAYHPLINLWIEEIIFTVDYICN